jgi:hypothetical protein
VEGNREVGGWGAAQWEGYGSYWNYVRL